MTSSQNILPPHLIPILPRYPLGEIKTVHKAYGMAEDNAIYIITTEGGKFVFKSRFNKGSLKYETAVLSHLKSRKSLAEEIVKTQDGNDYTQEQEKFYLAVKFIEGSLLQYRVDELTPEIIKEAGRTLAGIHLALKDFDFSAHKTRESSVLRIDKMPAIKKEITAFRTELDKKDKKSLTEAESLFLEKYKFLQGQLDILRMRFTPEIYARLPHGVVHGDYHPYNMFFSGSQITGVIDWEGCYYGPRIIDLSHFYFLLPPQAHPLDKDPSGQNKNQLPDYTIIKGYEEVIGKKHDTLNETEILYLPEALRLRLLQSIYDRFVMLFKFEADENTVCPKLKDQLIMLETLGKYGASKGIFEHIPALTILYGQIKRKLKRLCLKSV